ncbi:hypothetical protein LG276_03740 [Cytobacillus kochii]|uniref:hypothetical protein n=1 Tax=Cytobacillus kochii TaxID=859143 RepID=UPI00384D6D6F
MGLPFFCFEAWMGFEISYNVFSMLVLSFTFVSYVNASGTDDTSIENTGDPVTKPDGMSDGENGHTTINKTVTQISDNPYYLVYLHMGLVNGIILVLVLSKINLLYFLLEVVILEFGYLSHMLVLDLSGAIG